MVGGPAPAMRNTISHGGVPEVRCVDPGVDRPGVTRVQRGDQACSRLLPVVSTSHRKVDHQRNTFAVDEESSGPATRINTMKRTRDTFKKAGRYVPEQRFGGRM